jgi:hypothetical protein
MNEELLDAVRDYFSECVSKKDKNFSNGRLARNLYDDLDMNHAKRVVRIPSPSRVELSEIIKDDFKRPTQH